MPVLRQQQVAVGLLLVASDPAAQLVKICQAVAVRVVDEDRVDAGNVYAVLDDRGGDEDIDLAVEKS